MVEFAGEKILNSLTGLFTTSVVYNDLTNFLCEVILGVTDREIEIRRPGSRRKGDTFKKTHRDILQYPDAEHKELLKGYLKAAIELDANEGNFAITRLLKNTGQTDGVRKSFIRLSDKISKQIEANQKSLEKDGVKQEKKAKLETENIAHKEALDNVKKASTLLDRIDDGWIPFSDIYTQKREHTLIDGTFSLSDLDWSKSLRQVIQQSVEHLSSHFKLGVTHDKEIAAWRVALNEIEETEDYKSYTAVLGTLESALNDKRLGQLTPLDIIRILERYPEVLTSWRKPEVIASIPENLRETAAEASLEGRDRDNKRNFWIKELYEHNPELKALFDYHKIFLKSFSKPPLPPTYSEPDPVNHPRAVLWSKEQWKEIRLAHEVENKPKKGTWIEVKLPLIELTHDGAEEVPTWVKVSGDERLENLRRFSLITDKTKLELIKLYLKDIDKGVKETAEKVRKEKKKNFEEKAEALEAHYSEWKKEITSQELKVDPTWILQGVKYFNEHVSEFLLYDRRNDSFTPISIGAIRMVAENDLLDDGILKGGEYDIKVTLKRPRMNRPQWIREYLDSKQKKLQPNIPAGTIVVSFMHDPFNCGVIKAAKIENNGELKKFPDSIVSINGSSSQEIDAHRHRGEYLSNNRDFYQKRLLRLLREKGNGRFIDGELKENWDTRKDEILEDIDLLIFKLTTIGKDINEEIKDKIAETKSLIGDPNNLALIDGKIKCPKMGEIFKTSLTPESLRLTKPEKIKELKEIKEKLFALNINLCSGPRGSESEAQWGKRLKQLEQDIITARRNLNSRSEQNFEYVKNAGVDRVNKIASKVIDYIEELRRSNPGVDVVLCLEYRKALKPNSAWAKDFNRLMMAAQGGGLILKISQLAEDRPDPIHVLTISPYGMDSVLPGEKSNTLILKAIKDKNTGELRPPKSAKENPRVFKVNRTDNGLIIKEEKGGTAGVIATGFIRAFTDPHSTPQAGKVKMIKDSVASLWSDPDFIRILEETYAKA